MQTLMFLYPRWQNVQMNTLMIDQSNYLSVIREFPELSLSKFIMFTFPFKFAYYRNHHAVFQIRLPVTPLSVNDAVGKTFLFTM